MLDESRAEVDTEYDTRVGLQITRATATETTPAAATTPAPTTTTEAACTSLTRDLEYGISQYHASYYWDASTKQRQPGRGLAMCLDLLR